MQERKFLTRNEVAKSVAQALIKAKHDATA